MSIEIGPKDRRVFERVDGLFEIKYTSKSRKKAHITITKNISGGGMRILLLKRLSPGTVLDLEILKNDSNASARCRAEIVWILHLTQTRKKGKAKRDGMKNSIEAGIRFIDLSLVYINGLIDDLKARNAKVRLLELSSCRF